MHFHLKKGRQILDLSGNLILSKRDDLVTSFPSSAGPKRVRFAHYVPGLHKAGIIGKLKASRAALRFIWGRWWPWASFLVTGLIVTPFVAWCWSLI